MESALNTPLECPTLADQAFDKIVEAIMLGELPPGAQITEVLLARRLGISRGPLREAIRRLEGKKLVTRTPRVGTRVVSLSRRVLVDIFRVREALEGMACRLASQEMSGKELDELAAMLEEHRGNLEKSSGKSYFQKSGDYDFHFRIAKGSRNNMLVELLCEELYVLLRVYRYRSSVTPGRARKAFDEHTAIVEAMRARDGGRAETLMRNHIASAIKNLPESDFPPLSTAAIEDDTAKAGETGR